MRIGVETARYPGQDDPRREIAPTMFRLRVSRRFDEPMYLQGYLIGEKYNYVEPVMDHEEMVGYVSG